MGSFVFHKALLTAAIKIAVRCSLGLSSHEKISIARMEFQGKRFLLKEVTLLREDFALHVDEVQTRLSFDKTRTYFELKIDLIHPEITFNAEKKNNTPKILPLNMPGKHFGLKLDAYYGVLNNASSELHDRLYFNLKSIDSPDHLGTLTISNEPLDSTPPFFRLDCWNVGGEIFAEFQLHRSDLLYLRRLAHCLIPSALSNNLLVEGELEGNGKIAYSLKNHLQNINGHFAVKGLHFSHEELGLKGRLDVFESDIDYHPIESELSLPDLQGDFFKGMHITASLSDGEIAMRDPDQPDGWKFESIDAHLLIMPRSEPSLTLNTAFVRGEEKLPLHIQGKGAVLSDNKYWLELECEGFKEKERDLHGFLSLCKPDQEQIIVQTEVQALNSKHWSWIRGILEDLSGKSILGSMHSGRLKGVCTSTFHNGELNSVEWRDCALKDVQYSFPSGEIEVSLASFTSEGELQRDANRQWKLKKSLSCLEEGSFVFQNGTSPLEFEHFHGQIIVQDHHLEPSRFVGTAMGLNAELLFQQVEGVPQCALSLKGPLNNLVQKTPYICDIEFGALFTLKDQLEWQGSLSLRGNASSDDLEFGGILMYPLQPQGWFRSEKISGETLTALAHITGIKGQFQGEIDIYGTYTHEKIDCSLQTDQMFFKHPEYHVVVSELGKKDPQLIHVDNRAECTFNWKTRDLYATLPVTDASILALSKGLKLDHVSGNMILEKSGLSCETCHVSLGEAQFVGSLNAAWEQEGRTSIKWTAQRAQGSISELAGIVGMDSMGCDGEWFIGQDKLHIEGAFEKQHWNGRIKGEVQLEHVHMLGDNGLQVAEGTAILAFNSDSPFAQIQDASAQLIFKGTSAGIIKIPSAYIPLVPQESGSLTCALVEGAEPYVLSSAIITNNQDGWLVQIDPKNAQFLDCGVQKCSAYFSKQGSVRNLDAILNIPLSKFASRLEYLGRLGLLPFSALKSAVALQLSGNLLAQCNYDEKRNNLRILLDSKDLSMKGEKAHTVACAAECSDGQLTITRALWDDLRLTAQLSLQQDSVRVSTFECAYQDWIVVGDGIYNYLNNSSKGSYSLKVPSISLSSVLQGAFQARGTFITQPPQIDKTFKVVSTMNFSLLGSSQLEGKANLSWNFGDPIIFEKVEARLLDPSHHQEVCHFKAEQCQYDWNLKQFATQGAHLALFPYCVNFCSQSKNSPEWIKAIKLEQPLSVRCSATMAENAQTFEGKVSETQASYLGYPLRLRDIKMRVSGSRIETVGVFVLEQEKLLFRAVYNPSSDNILTAKLSDAPDAEGLHISFQKSVKGSMVLNKIEGQIAGAHLNFQCEKLREGSSILKGGISADIRQILPFLPPELKNRVIPMKLGAGYSFIGKIALPDEGRPFSVSGELKGDNFEILGNRYDHFAANVQGNVKEIVVQDLQCSDRALELEVKKIHFLKNKEEWICQVPLIQMKDFKPSAIRSVQGNDKSAKPFAITHLTLKNVLGRAGDLKSFIGEGMLRFSNAMKRDLGVFDLPLSMLKDVGLDPSVLNPYSGEVSIILQKGKLHFTELAQCFSEGRRSEFYLAESPSFITLDGKVNINLRIKQNSVLKIVEPFTLSVTGTLDKLQYSLK